MQSEVRIHKVLVSPDGREKVELFGPHDGLYGFRTWRRDSEAWRLTVENRENDSYPRAVLEAGRQVEWLGRALAPDRDWRLASHLELLRGHTFDFATYTEQRFGDHDHCSACWVKFAERDWPDTHHQGYVTRDQIPNGSGDSQWNWVCEKCFSDLHAEMQWQVGKGPNH